MYVCTKLALHFRVSHNFCGRESWKKMKVLLFGVAVLFSLYVPQRVSSLPDGAPAGACDNLTPSPGPTAHSDPQTTAFPYRLDLSALCYNGTLTYTPGGSYNGKGVVRGLL